MHTKQTPSIVTHRSVIHQDAIPATKFGTKEVPAVETGVRESTESWKAVLRSLKDRGLPPPRLTIADVHLGIWGALAQFYPASAEQRCREPKGSQSVSWLAHWAVPRVPSSTVSLPFE